MADFYAKLNIALKEADEIEYWLDLLHESGYLDEKQCGSINDDAEELIKLLTSVAKTLKRQIQSAFRYGNALN